MLTQPASVFTSRVKEATREREGKVRMRESERKRGRGQRSRGIQWGTEPSRVI